MCCWFTFIKNCGEVTNHNLSPLQVKKAAVFVISYSCLLIFKTQNHCTILKHYSMCIVSIGTLIIWTVKFLIRPFIHIPADFKMIFGIAPNLIGSFLLPFGACWFFQRFFRMQNTGEVRITCWFGLLLVVINEYLQLIPIFGRTFDYLDILFSFVGVFGGYIVFSKLLQRQSIKASLKNI